MNIDCCVYWDVDRSVGAEFGIGYDVRVDSYLGGEFERVYVEWV